MNRISFALAACGIAVGAGVASAQGLGGGQQNRPDPAQVQQKIQEQIQQRIQAQAETRAQAQTQIQAQRAAERVQQRLEAQAQNQAARAEAAAQRIADGVQQRVDAQANAAARMQTGQGVRATTQAGVDSEAGFESADAPFGPFNPIRAAAGLQVSAKARARANANARATSGDPTATTEEPGDEQAGTLPSRGLRVGQFTDLRGTARAELARTMALRLTAISAMRDRAIEAEDVQLLEKADRLEAAVRRVLDARAQGQVDVEAETVVETELPAAEVESRTNVDGAVGVETDSASAQP